MVRMAYFKCPVPKLRRMKKNLLGEGAVTYPVSYRYNGGIVVDGKWYEGYEVPPPKIPKGFELVGLGLGLQLNARPPIATMYLQRKRS